MLIMLIVVMVSVSVVDAVAVEVPVEVVHVVVVVLVGVVEHDVKVAGVDGAAGPATDAHLKATEAEAGERIAHALLARAEVEQRTDDHVSRDAAVTPQKESPAHVSPVLASGRGVVDERRLVARTKAIVDVHHGDAART